MDEFSFDLGTQRNRLCLEIFIVCNAPHNIKKVNWNQGTRGQILIELEVTPVIHIKISYDLVGLI